MARFKKGDRVRRTGSDTTLLVRGEIYTIREIDVDGDLYLEGFIVSYVPGYFELVDGNRTTTPTDTSWQFISKHPFDINWDELAKDMSYKNPLVLVQRGERFFVVVSGELAAKAELIKNVEWEEELPNLYHYLNDAKGCVFETDQSLYSEWIRWAKEIKEAAWPDKDEQVVKVQVVNI